MDLSLLVKNIHTLIYDRRMSKEEALCEAENRGWISPEHKVLIYQQFKEGIYRRVLKLHRDEPELALVALKMIGPDGKTIPGAAKVRDCKRQEFQDHLNTLDANVRRCIASGTAFFVFGEQIWPGQLVWTWDATAEASGQHPAS